MTGNSFEATRRSIIQRLPGRGSYDRETIYGILDAGILCHVGMTTDSGAVVIPMGYARRGDELILHGSAKSRLLNTLAEGADVCVTVTLVDGLVLARSTFHHSMNYRSVVLFGRAEAITNPKDKNEALEALVEHLVPGRGRDARGASEGELAATIVVRVPIREASAKIRTGPPVDEKRDLEIPIWAGVVPFEKTIGEPLRDEHTGEEVAVPEYIRSYPKGRL
jgi:nitroimidazol reductase NimA-like FMN-containing flavoprotein (pyridoxamine 5'-phosphate oxidase superfamily)